LNKNNKNDYPLVTIFTLIYNTNPRFIIEAIESVRANNYPNIQHIIIDDCSPNPEPKEIVKNWIKNENYKCEFYEHKLNFGLSQTLNHVLELSQGEFILGCCDDVLMPNRIHTDIEFLRSNENSAISFGKCIYIDENGLELNSIDNGFEILKKLKKMPNSLIEENFIIAPSVTFSKEKLIEIGGFQPQFLIEDYPTWLEFLKHGFELSFRNEFVVKYRIHPSSFSKKNEAVMLIEDLKIKIKYSTYLDKNHLRYVRFHAFKIGLMYPNYFKELIKVYRIANDNNFFYFVLYFTCNPILNPCINFIRRLRLRLIKDFSTKLKLI
jgi:glycosyltransferase involved in cell wall biosynthesis